MIPSVHRSRESSGEATDFENDGINSLLS